MCTSTTHNKIGLNRLDNGVVITEMLEPIDVSQYSLNDARALADHCHQLMAAKIAQLDQEVAQIERKSGLAHKPKAT